jgi:tetratricopeptide (TPR) repeat protein
VTHFVCAAFLAAPVLFGQLQTRPAKPSAETPGAIEQEPPEEDPDLVPKTYEFNPLEAVRNITAGNFYFKKGNMRAARNRYLEASRWDPTSQEALLKLAEAQEKMHDWPGVRDTYGKYLALNPDEKNAVAVKKKLAKLPHAQVAKPTADAKKP